MEYFKVVSIRDGGFHSAFAIGAANLEYFIGKPTRTKSWLRKFGLYPLVFTTIEDAREFSRVLRRDISTTILSNDKYPKIFKVKIGKKVKRPQQWSNLHIQSIHNEFRVGLLEWHARVNVPGSGNVFWEKAVMVKTVTLLEEVK